MSSLLLASTSPRRKAILAWAGFDVEAMASGVEEVVDPDLTPLELAQSLADQKALAVASAHPGRWVVAFDTLGFQQENLLLQPRDEDDARRLWDAHAASPHEIVTAMTLIDPEGDILVRGRTGTRVDLTAVPIDVRDEYLASGTWQGKAGAYGLQDPTLQRYARVEGPASNVVGLPMDALSMMARVMGLPEDKLDEEAFMVAMKAGRFA